MTYTQIPPGTGPVTGADWARIACPADTAQDLPDWLNPPKEVADAVTEYRQTVTKVRAARRKVEDAKKEVTDTERQDMLAQAHISRFGGKDQGFVATQKAEANLVDAQRRLAGAELGARHSLATLRHAVTQHADEWRQTLTAEADKVRQEWETVAQRITDLQDKARIIGATRSTINDAANTSSTWKASAWAIDKPGEQHITQARTAIEQRLNEDNN